MSEPATKLRVTLMNGVYFDVGTAFTWPQFINQLRADGFLLTEIAFIPIHSIASVARTDGNAPLQMAQPAGAA